MNLNIIRKCIYFSCSSEKNKTQLITHINSLTYANSFQTTEISQTFR